MLHSYPENFSTISSEQQKQIPEPNFHLKRKQLTATPQREMRHHEEEDGEEPE